jgi:hypothetical protein
VEFTGKSDRLTDHLAIELIRLDLRTRQESKPLATDTCLGVAVRKLPAQWTKAICEALSLPVSSKDVERKAAITQCLLAPDSVRETWRKLPEPSRRIVAWLVLERGGFATVRELYDEFGADDDYSYFWNKGELPTTALGLLRLHGIVFKGWTASRKGSVKVAVVPLELREHLKSVALTSRNTPPAPPLPEPAFRKTSPKPESLEAVVPGRTARRRGYANVYQFMIVLEGVSPTVWRRIQVPENYSFWDLHVAIQDGMGWLDYHLHEFGIPALAGGPTVALGFPDEEFAERKILPDYAEYISDYFSTENSGADYLYDFGDGWQHSVRLEAVLPARSGIHYPICLGGERACPPEDCGGPPGFEDFLRIIKDPSDEEHAETLAWVGGSYEPGRFEPSAVHFDDPYIRWRVAFLGDADARESLMLARRGVDLEKPVTHTNRRGDLYYLHSGKNKAGKPTCHFSRKATGSLVGRIPQGYEVYEHPDGRVYLRKIQKKIITDGEKKIVEASVKAAGVADSIVEVKKNSITVFLGDLTEDSFSGLFDVENLLSGLLMRLEGLGLPVSELAGELLPEILKRAPAFKTTPADLLKNVQTYSPMLKFTLLDAGERSFTVERACFMGGSDEWMWLDGPGDLRELSEKYCKHLGEESFYDLW